MRARREASLSYRGHAIFLIDFHDIYNSEESHDGCDRRISMILTVAKKVMVAVIEGLCWWRGGLVAMKTLGTGFLCVGVGDLQQRPWQEGAATQLDNILVVLNTEP